MVDNHDVDPAREFRSEEERVEARSAVFKKELGLTDLALTQILFIVGLPYCYAYAWRSRVYVGLSVAPIIQVESRSLFAIKISGLIVVANVIGLAIFLTLGRKRRSRRSREMSAATD